MLMVILFRYRWVLLHGTPRQEHIYGYQKIPIIVAPPGIKNVNDDKLKSICDCIKDV